MALYPLQHKDFKVAEHSLHNGKKYHIGYPIGVDSGSVFDTVRVPVPSEGEKSFEEWYKDLEDAVDTAL